MQIKPFQAIYPDMGLVSSADHFFSTVKEKFNEYLLSGYYEQLPDEGMFVCQIQRAERSHVGLLTSIDIGEYFSGSIKRHEKTLAASEQEQILRLLHRSAQVKPVLMTYPTVSEVEEILYDYIENHPCFIETVFETSREVHRFWHIQHKETLSQLEKLFAEKVNSVFIADGHHRTSAFGLLYKRLGADNPDNPFRWLSCALFPTDEVEIYDFNRIIENTTEMSSVHLMAKLSKLFEIEVLETAQKPTKKHELTMYLEKEWYKLTWRREILLEHKDDPVILDVSLLNEKVLVDILGVKDVRTDHRVRYIEGISTMAALREKTIKRDERFAFCLYPVSIKDFLKVANAGDSLPPKSTWFEPRIRSGLLVKKFENVEI